MVEMWEGEERKNLDEEVQGNTIEEEEGKIRRGRKERRRVGEMFKHEKNERKYEFNVQKNE